MKYTKKFKEDIVTRYSNGESVHDLFLSTRASVSTIYSWIKTSVGIVPVTGLHKTIKEQEKKISRLESMIKIIQNSDFFKNVSLSERLEIIDEKQGSWQSFAEPRHNRSKRFRSLPKVPKTYKSSWQHWRSLRLMYASR